MTESSRKILCPIDFSDHSKNALAASIDLASRFGGEAKVLVLYADLFEPPPYFTSGQEKKLLETIDRSIKATKKKVEQFIKEFKGSRIKPVPLVKQGHPASAILETAKEEGVEIILMGSHGKSGFSRFMLGSVTERVLAETTIPLLTIPPPAKAGHETFSPKKIYCPVDFSEVSSLALKEAAELARTLGSELIAVHVVEGRETKDAKAKLCSFVPPLGAATCSLDTIVKSGHAAEEVIKLAGKGTGSLIALGASRKPLGDVTVFGQTVVKVTRHAKCPVLVIPFSG